MAKVGDSVWFPQPMMPVAEKAGRVTPRPTGDEEWHRGVVKRIDHYEAVPPHDHDGDRVATVEPSGGLTVQVPVNQLRRRKP